MTEYTLLERKARGLAFLQARLWSRRVQNQLWAGGLTRGRAKQCAVCCGQIPPGAWAFRPLGNYENRAERICEPCINAASGGAK